MCDYFYFPTHQSKLPNPSRNSKRNVKRKSAEGKPCPTYRALFSSQLTLSDITSYLE